MNNARRREDHADGVVSELRQLMQLSQPVVAPEDREQLERTVSARIATVLMVLLVMIIFVTSAIPDVGPSLAKVIQAHW